MTSDSAYKSTLRSIRMAASTALFALAMSLTPAAAVTVIDESVVAPGGDFDDFFSSDLGNFRGTTTVLGGEFDGPDTFVFTLLGPSTLVRLTLTGLLGTPIGGIYSGNDFSGPEVIDLDPLPDGTYVLPNLDAGQYAFAINDGGDPYNYEFTVTSPVPLPAPAALLLAALGALGLAARRTRRRASHPVGAPAPAGCA